MNTALGKLKGMDHRPNVQPCLPIDELAKQYTGSDFFRCVVDQFKQEGFTHYRGVRGDGNCYYRSVSYSYIEKLALSHNISAFSNLITHISNNQYYYSLEEEKDSQDEIQAKAKDVLVKYLKGIVEFLRGKPSQEMIFSYV